MNKKAFEYAPKELWKKLRIERKIGLIRRKTAYVVPVNLDKAGRWIRTDQ